MQSSACSVHFVPGMRVIALDFAAQECSSIDCASSQSVGRYAGDCVGSAGHAGSRTAAHAVHTQP
eukprot:3426094-Rhodomonas_salina.3